MTVPAVVKQADIGRAMREAKKHGAKRVRIGADGSIDIILVEEHIGAADVTSAQPTPPERRSLVGPPDKTSKVTF
jgi:hypothetical protein